jgi:hypothetical protein
MLVTAWIGPSTELTSLAIKCIKYRSLKVQDIMEDDHYESEEDHRYKNALVDWSSRDYWRRLWVVQEYLLAKDVRVMCGAYELGLADLYSVITDYNNVVDKEASEIMTLRVQRGRSSGDDIIEEPPNVSSRYVVGEVLYAGMY